MRYVYDPRRDRILNCTFTLGKDIRILPVDEFGNKLIVLGEDIFLFGNNLFLERIDFEKYLYKEMLEGDGNHTVYVMLMDGNYTPKELDNIQELTKEVKTFTVKGVVATIGLEYAFSIENEFIPHFGLGNMFPIDKGWFRTNYTISQSGYSTKLKTCNFFYLFTLVNGVEFLITFITPAFISKDLTESVLRNFRELLIENGEMDKCLIHFEKSNTWVDLNPFHTPRYFNIYEAVIGHNSLIQKFLSMDKTFMGAITDDINLIINFSAVRYH